MSAVKDSIREFLSHYGISIVGFGHVPADIETLEINERLPRVVSFGYRLSKTVLATIKDRPTLIYKHHYKTVNWLLDQTSYHLANFIEDKGFRALAIPASQLVDWVQHKGHISHRHLAAASGLGYIGRSGLLVNPMYGAQVRYTSVLTDLDFEPDTRLSNDCGTCTSCIAACPAAAISADSVNMQLCFEKLEQFAKIRGIGQHICGICVKVCDGRN